jgi:hypothetical protein
MLQDRATALPLEAVQNVLRIYVEGLTGSEIENRALAGDAARNLQRIGEGKDDYSCLRASRIRRVELDFRLYKVFAAHGARTKSNSAHTSAIQTD